MDIASYVKENREYLRNVGEQANQSTKYRAKLDRKSLVAITLANHLIDLIERQAALPKDSYLMLEEEELDKLLQYVLCLKKEINFYANMDVDPDCILTENENHIIQE